MTSEVQMAVAHLQEAVLACKGTKADADLRAAFKAVEKAVRALLASHAKLEEEKGQLSDTLMQHMGRITEEMEGRRAAEARLAALTDKAENAVIAYGMGWDIYGAIDALRTALSQAAPVGDGPKNLCGSPSASRGTGEGGATPSEGGR